ncbi:MAG TPA: isocitrate lyase/phosphoenolpyruvate mutase family protein [Capillimicrobium sp.]|nr:isocitrate lyase/phosphoenolpyruvate mutase family protein [Capillimicrobium sp.]
MATPAERADRLRALHRGPDVLVLPNAWDPPSARRFVADGAVAVATSSAAVARALGSEDHEAMRGAEMLAAVARIREAVGDDVPVTADMEAGYGLSPEALVEGLLRAGAVGCNLEDTDHDRGGLRAVAEQVEWLTLVKAAGRAAGVDLVVNARVDVHLHDGTVEEGLERARAYRAAGADCVYPILAPLDALGAYVEAAEVVNALATLPDGPAVAELRALGVARVTFGGGLATVALEAASAAWRGFAGVGS